MAAPEASVRPGTSARATDLYPALSARPRASAVVGAAFIAFSGIFFRLSGVSPATATVFRCGLALPVLLVLMLYEDRRLGGRGRHARLLALAAGVFFAFDLVLWMSAVVQVGAGLATVLANMQVVVVALVGWLLLGERPSNRTLAAIPIVGAGAVCISGVLETGAYGASPALGVVLGLGAAVAYSGYLLLIRRGNRDGRVFGPLFDATTATTLVAMVIGLAIGELDLTPGWPGFGWLMLVAFTSQVAGYGLVNVALPRLPAALTSLLLLVQPVVTVIAGALLLGEAPSPLQLTGVGFVLGGLLVATAPIGKVRDAVAARRAEEGIEPTIGGE